MEGGGFDISQNPFILTKEERRFSISNNHRLSDMETRKAFNKLGIMDKGPKVARTRQVVKSNILPARRESRRRLMEKSYRNAKSKAMEYKTQQGINTYIHKKRSLCLANMTIRSKRAEMKALEEKARLKEEALHQSQVLLEEDAMRFDAFIREIDAQVADLQEQLEKTDLELELKGTEVQKLCAAIQKAEQETKKKRAALKKRKTYKKFLDSLTPGDVVEQNAKKRQEEVVKILAEEPHVQDDDIEIEEVMYYEKVSQMMEQFKQQEEENLFTISRLQEAEHKLEVLKDIYTRKKNSLEEEEMGIDASIKKLSAKLAIQTEKISVMDQVAVGEDDRVVDPRRLLKRISETVNTMYNILLPPNAMASHEVLEQLKDVEGWMDKLLLRADAMHPTDRAKAEKRNELNKRKIHVQKKKEEALRLNEERKQKALARMVSNLKPPGKMLMARSRPINRIRKSKNSKNRKNSFREPKEAAEYRKFFTMEDDL
eukprot:jgi/Bigna1/131742/aug1.15_g6450